MATNPQYEGSYHLGWPSKGRMMTEDAYHELEHLSPDALPHQKSYPSEQRYQRNHHERYRLKAGEGFFQTTRHES